MDSPWWVRHPLLTMLIAAGITAVVWPWLFIGAVNYVDWVIRVAG